MKKMWKAIMVIVILIILFFIIRPVFTGNAVDEERLKIDKFAQCLTDSGLVMYGTEWCSHCQNQKKLFGKSFEYINFVDCDRNSVKCNIEGITGYPTWKINGQNYAGEQPLIGLSQMTECELE